MRKSPHKYKYVRVLHNSKGTNHLPPHAWDSLCLFFIHLSVVCASLAKIFVFQSLHDFLQDVVADILLRFLVLEDIAATIDANLNHAFDIVLQRMQKVLNGLLVCKIKLLLNLKKKSV